MGVRICWAPTLPAPIARTDWDSPLGAQARRPGPGPRAPLPRLCLPHSSTRPARPCFLHTRGVSNTYYNYCEDIPCFRLQPRRLCPPRSCLLGSSSQIRRTRRAALDLPRRWKSTSWSARCAVFSEHEDGSSESVRGPLRESVTGILSK